MRTRAKVNIAMDNWNAEITNNPDDDYPLYIEIIKNENHIGRIIRDENQELRLHFYNEESNITCEWLLKIIESAKKDI